MCDNDCESLGDDGHDWEGDERHPTVAFGRIFTHVPEHVRQVLETLERECVVYADHWIEEVGDFRHVRIDFTPEERDEFARRSWAYELFLRAEPTWAAEVPGIDEDIARDADTYSALLTDGTVRLNVPKQTRKKSKIAVSAHFGGVLQHAGEGGGQVVVRNSPIR